MIPVIRKRPQMRIAKIKHKLFVIFALIVSFLCSSTFAALRYAYHIYDEQLYAESAKSLNISANIVDMELKKAERLSYNIISESDVQNLLGRLKNEISDYGRFMLLESLKNKLIPYSNGERYVTSIHYIDLSGKEISVGTTPDSMPEDKKADIQKATAERHGGTVWLLPGKDGRGLILARDILSWSYQNLELEKLGTLLIRIDLEQIVYDLTNRSGLDSRMLIMAGDRPVYAEGEPDPTVFHSGIVLGERQGYDVVRWQDRSYFRTYVQSDYTGWLYMHVIPYDRIFESTSTMKKMIVLAFVLLLSLVGLLGFRLTRRITRPIDSLSRQMRLVGMGNFDIPEASPESSAMDELGMLHRNLRIMVEKINDLIRDNYIKQLAIKEAEYKALQAQINPHFLYNTLESINWLAKMNRQPKISAMVEALGGLLRSSINPKSHLITIDEEIRIVEHYTVIQKIRFEDQLNIAIEIPESVRQCLIPKLTLQPVLENAIQYGLDRMVDACRIRIFAEVSGDDVIVTVADNGPGIDREFLDSWREGQIRARGTGIGLKNIDERIKFSFGESYGIELDSEPGRETRVRIRIPRKEGDSHV